ncbi:hypothetical protein L207DRAFT_321582 [Hyaloscypha variabilis F]|uniref:Uncharacterized protein n=1 Tax=Hyaloscypha variabilis (strain UAMH 11265 / GT02V1 / F) TaxID=1149755 RepID=A0A2J6RRN1_HYAVF|nr:hypothetical protein L207DRAFT_321582 [Hyaloscypha variabilis F]
MNPKDIIYQRIHHVVDQACWQERTQGHPHISKRNISTTYLNTSTHQPQNHKSKTNQNIFYILYFLFLSSFIIYARRSSAHQCNHQSSNASQMRKARIHWY